MGKRVPRGVSLDEAVLHLTPEQLVRLEHAERVKHEEAEQRETLARGMRRAVLDARLGDVPVRLLAHRLNLTPWRIYQICAQAAEENGLPVPSP